MLDKGPPMYLVDAEVARQLERKNIALSAQVAELKTNARRYEYWRDCGICIGDAPVSFMFLEELDKFTDQAIKESGSG